MAKYSIVIWGRNSVLKIFLPYGSHGNENEEKSLTIVNWKFQKPKTVVLWGPLGKKSGEVWIVILYFRLRFVGGVAFSNFRSHRLPCYQKRKTFIKNPLQFKKCPRVWPRGSNNQSLKEIRSLHSEIIVTPTMNGWLTDDGQISISWALLT